MLPDILKWVASSKTGRFVGALYVLGLIIAVLPQLVIGTRQAIPRLAEQYREAFAGTIQPKEASPPNAVRQLPVDRDVQNKLAALEADLVRLRNTGSAARIDSLENSIKELREAISGDPTRALTLQRIAAEQTSMTSRVDSLQTQMQWLFGISMTLALGVLATVVSVVKSSFEKKAADTKI